MYPDRVAVVHGERRLTYRELGERAGRLASALRGAGLEPGDRVASLCPNIPAQLEAHFGVPAAGGVLVALNYRLTAADVAEILDHSGARFLLVDRELEHLVADAGSTLEVIRVDDTGAPGDPYEDLLAGGSPEPARLLALRRGGDDRDRLHVGHDRAAQGGDVQPPRRVPERALRRRHGRDPPRQRVPVDAPDVPLQRVVLHLGRHRGGRPPRLPPQARARGGLGPPGERAREPLQRRAHGPDRADRTRARAAAWSTRCSPASAAPRPRPRCSRGSTSSASGRCTPTG